MLIIILFITKNLFIYLNSKVTYIINKHCKTFLVLQVQSAKILLLPPKYVIIIVLSNHSVFQYCYSNIGLFFIALCKAITLNPLCILFLYQFFASFLTALFLKLSLFLALKGDREKIIVTFRLPLRA